MSPLPSGAIRISTLGLPKLTWESDLLYFDGPILSSYRSSTRETYLLYWLGRDSEIERWLVARVGRREFLRLSGGLVGLRTVLTKGIAEEFVLVVDFAADGHPSSAAFLPLILVDDTLLPPTDAPLDSPGTMEDIPQYPILTSGEWEMDDMAYMTRRFVDAYATLHHFQATQIPEVGSHPWRGGYSSMHFFKEVLGQVRSNVRPRVEAVQWSSPGFVQIRAERSVGRLVAEVVHRVVANIDRAGAILARLENYIRVEELNHAGRPTLSREQSATLRNYARQLQQVMVVPTWEWIDSLSSDAFETAKIVMAIYRRISDLAWYVHDGSIELPKV